MTRLERLVIWALLTLGFCGCTRTVETRSESAVQETAAVQERASSTLDEVVQTGPSTTTVYKFALPDSGNSEAKSSAGDFQFPAPSPRSPTTGNRRAPSSRYASNLPAHGALVEMDVIQIGQILDTKRQASTEASSATLTVKAEKKATTKTKTAPALSTYVWLALAAVVVGAIGWVAWKLSPLGKVL